MANRELASLRGFFWFTFLLGLLAMLVGFLAIGAPHIATWKTILLLGVLLLIAGAVEVVHALVFRSFRSFAMHMLAAALYLFVGLFMLEDPDRAAGVLTLLLAAGFLVGGGLRILFSLVERFPAWPWVLLNGVVDLFLGWLIWSGWPESSLWVIGLFIGIELILHGWSWVILALMLRMSPAR
jgi:uncharacterized membrane protein HdeD (DUF308 family)